MARNTLLKSYTSKIPRRTLLGRKVFLNKDTSSVFQNKVTLDDPETYEEFDVVNCTVHPVTRNDVLVLDEGLRDRESYYLITDTPVLSLVEDTNRKGDQIQYESLDGSLKWFTVQKVIPCSVGVIPHYEAIIVKEPQR